jgi:hypothetical protein
MNAITTADQVSAQTLETVLGTGDLSKLSTQQRVEYYTHVCRSLGLNPLTRPFRLMTFQGQTVMYATRDCGDQLRSTRGISVQIASKEMDGDLFIVTARATTKDGRSDEARANAIMKAMTKAKRRVTLSICGLGFLDETEVETLRGAETYNHETPMRQAVRSLSSALSSAPQELDDEIPALADEGPTYRLVRRDGTLTFASGSEWIAKWRAACEGYQKAGAPMRLKTLRLENAAAFEAVLQFDPAAVEEVDAMIDAAIGGAA